MGYRKRNPTFPTCIDHLYFGSHYVFLVEIIIAAVAAICQTKIDFQSKHDDQRNTHLSETYVSQLMVPSLISPESRDSLDFPRYPEGVLKSNRSPILQNLRKAHEHHNNKRAKNYSRPFTQPQHTILPRMKTAFMESTYFSRKPITPQEELIIDILKPYHFM